MLSACGRSGEPGDFDRAIDYRKRWRSFGTRPRHGRQLAQPAIAIGCVRADKEEEAALERSASVLLARLAGSQPAPSEERWALARCKRWAVCILSISGHLKRPPLPSGAVRRWPAAPATSG